MTVNHLDVRTELDPTKAKGRYSANCATPEDPITERNFTTVTTGKGESRIDSRLIAHYLGIKNQSLCDRIALHKADFEQLGLIRFQNDLIARKGRPEKFALLNEDQAFLVLTFRRNSPKIVAMKVALIKTFSEARRAVGVRNLEYLPEYHALHDAIKQSSAGSPSERWAHLNANREINRIAGLQPGQRVGAGPLTQSLLALTHAVATKAVKEASGGNLHQSIKVALKPLETLMIGAQ